MTDKEKLREAIAYLSDPNEAARQDGEFDAINFQDRLDTALLACKAHLATLDAPVTDAQRALETMEGQLKTIVIPILKKLDRVETFVEYDMAMKSIQIINVASVKVKAAQAHLATLDAVSKEDAELSFAWLKDREWEWPVGSTSQKRLETIYTLIRAHAGVS